MQTDLRVHRSRGTMFKKVRSGPAAFYSEPAVMGNEAQSQIVRCPPAHAAQKTGLLRHASFVECCHPHTPVSDRVYSRAVSVHRFQRVAGRVQEGQCRTTTRKPTYGQGCERAVSYCRPSSSCDLQNRVTARLTQNTYATSAQIGGVAIEFCKSLGINTIKFTWVPALAGSSGCSIEGSTTAGRSLFTTLEANICSALLACGQSTVGTLPQRKADRPAPHPTSRRGNGQCAILPRQQRIRTRKQSRPTLAGRAAV